jgi:hypothetical protein
VRHQNKILLSLLKLLKRNKMAAKKIKTAKKSECGEKTKKAFQAGLNVGRNMKKPITKKKK